MFWLLFCVLSTILKLLFMSCSLNWIWTLVDVLETIVKQFGTSLKWLSCELDLNLFVVFWTCVQLHLSSFSVSCALSLGSELQCLWTLLELVDLHGKVLQTLATGLDESTSGTLDMH